MLEVSEIIYSILNADATLTGLGIDVQPVISDQSSKIPLVNYAVSELAGITKDGGYPYRISIRIYAESYKQGLAVADAVKNAFEAATENFRYDGTQEPQPDVDGEFYIESNYQLKK